MKTLTLGLIGALASLAVLPPASAASPTMQLQPANGEARLIKAAWVYERRYHTVRRWVPVRRHHHYAYYGPRYRYYDDGYYAPPPVVFVGPPYGYYGGWRHHHWRRW